MKRFSKLKRYINTTISAILIIALMTNPIFAVGDIDFIVTRSTNPAEGQILAGAPFTMTYTIQPKPVEADQIQTSEVVLVIDTSGSMSSSAEGGGSRIAAAKGAATNFVNYFALNSKLKDKVKISVVDYSSSARVKKGLVYSNDATLLTTISGLPTSGYTNIGDGIRRGFYELKAGSSNAKKFMVFMTDGYANRSSYYWDGLGYPYLYDNRSSNYYTGNYDAFGYAQRMVDRLNVGSSINSNMSIQGYFIAFSNNAASLETIAKKPNGTMRLTNSEFVEVGTASSLNTYYQAIAKEIEAALSFDLNFQETFIGSIDIDSVLDEDVLGIGGNEVVIQTIDGKKVVSSDTDGWPVSYSLNDAGTHYIASSITMDLRITPKDSGEFVYGKDGSSYLEFNVPGSTTGEPESIILPEQTFTARRVNAPQINMSQDEDSELRTFTLSYTGLANMHFGGQSEGDYVTFDHGWSDSLFHTSHDEWTIRAVIEPETLDKSESTNHNIENVFISKASNSHNDNLEIGINAAGHLEVYLDTLGRDGMVTFDQYVIGTGQQHDIVVSYDHGRLTATIDGYEYVKTDYNNYKMDQAVGSYFSLGASRHVDAHFDGKMNQVTVFNRAFSAQEIYDGVPLDSEIEADWHTKNATAIQLKDTSGNDRHSTDIAGTFIQSDLNPDHVKMFYKIDVVEGTASDVDWTLYTEGDIITALSVAGEAIIYSKAVYDNPSDSYLEITSDVVQKTAYRAEGNYIKRILMSSVDSDAVSDEQIVEDEYVTVTYSFEGDPFKMTGETAAEVTINPVTITIAYPDNTSPATPTGFTADAANKRFTMTKSDVKVKKITSGTDAGKYQLDSFDVLLRLDATSYKNFTLTVGSGKVAYKDNFNHDRSLSNTNAIDIKVLPEAPSIDPIGDGNKVYQLNISDVDITGESKYNRPIYMYVSGVNVNDVGIADDETVNADIDSDGDGKYDYKVESIDMTLYKPLLDVTATATVTDLEGDSNSSQQKFKIIILDLGVDIK